MTGGEPSIPVLVLMSLWCCGATGPLARPFHNEMGCEDPQEGACGVEGGAASPGGGG